MTYRTILRVATLAMSLLLASSPSQAFWFLPSFETQSARDAREQMMDIEERAPGPTAGNSPTIEQREQTSGPEDAPESKAIASEDISVPGERDETPFVSNAPAEILDTPEADNTSQALSSILDFDLEALAAYQERPEPIAVSGPLSSHEMDMVLSPQTFDMAYDLSDGAIQPALSTFPISVFLEVEKGDTLSRMFQEVGISITETSQVATELNEHFEIARLRPGMVIELELNGAVAPFDANRLQRLAFSPRNLELIEVRREDDRFIGQKTEIELNRVLVYAAGPLQSGSVWIDGDAMDIESRVVASYVNALDSQLNFSRIQSVGDEIEMIYEAYFSDEGRLVEVGNVLYAAFNDQNQETYEAFRFENDGKAAYFTRDARFTGQTNTLMRKPLGGGRLTSRYGMRTHPVYGDRRMHNGVDYGASCGTPIYAAGDGFIRFAGWKGGYGRFISIKHGSTYTTNYAHMRSFANGMRPGVRVRKGQLIGRVGTTGVSTGCHLHYEVVKNGRHINPLSDHIPRGSDLTSGAKTRFQAFVAQLDSEREDGVTFDQALARARSGIY